MIIRATFSDNDYTEILEKFFARFKFTNYPLYYYSLKDKDDMKSLLEFRKRYIECDELLNKIVYHQEQMTDEEMARFAYIVTESIKEFIKLNYNEDYTYLIDKIQVNVINSLEDKNENGEVVYYIISSEKYLTM